MKKRSKFLYTIFLLLISASGCFSFNANPCPFYAKTDSALKIPRIGGQVIGFNMVSAKISTTESRQVTDVSGYNNHGTTETVASYDSKIGPYLNLKGGDSLAVLNGVTVPDNNSLFFSDEFTAVGVIRRKSLANADTVFAKYGSGGNEYIAGFFTDSLMLFWCFDSTNVTYIGRSAPSSQFPLNEWLITIFRKAPGTTNAKLNIFVGSKTLPVRTVDSANFTAGGLWQQMRNGTENLYVGFCQAGLAVMDGANLDIAWFSLYNRALSNDEIRGLEGLYRRALQSGGTPLDFQTAFNRAGY